MKNNKFTKLIEQHLDVLNEQEPEEVTPPVPEDPTATGTETSSTALPDEDAGDDDTVKMKVDYVEMIRKALIMAPKHIDDVDYARLTKIVDTENLEEMQELVSRIVRNNYPHPDL